MTENSPGWAVELRGEKIDVDDFRELLARPFEPWVEDHQTEDGVIAVLRTSGWALMTEATDVLRDAGRMVERLYGEVLLIQNDAKPLTLGRIIRFGLDGKPMPVIVAAIAHAHGNARGRGRATVVTSKPSPPPQESKLQKWFREADNDDKRAELFAHLARATNWYDLYKSAELTRRIIGKDMNANLGPDRKEWDRIWQTANCYRHAPDPVKFPLPPSPPKFDDAREFILKSSRECCEVDQGGVHEARTVERWSFDVLLPYARCRPRLCLRRILGNKLRRSRRPAGLY
jgi:hypothetical protein